MIDIGRDKQINLYTEFATKQELISVDIKVDDLIKGSAEMAAAIKGLTESMDKISTHMQTLVSQKASNDLIRKFVIKCVCVTGSTTVSLITLIATAHWAGIIKFLMHWASN